MTSRTLTLLLLLATSSISAAAGPRDDSDDSVPEIRWEPYETMGADDQPLVGRIGRFHVPESRDRPPGRRIELAFAHFPSTNPDPGPPIFFLAGGPGGPGIEGCIGPATGRMLQLLQYGDVVGLDQRGVGRSVPNLMGDSQFPYQLPLDEVVTREDVIGADMASVRKVVAHWTKRGVDLAAYNSAASADDVDDLRRALGYEKIVTFGSSYGAHLSLAYLRRHAEHVERSIIMRVEGPDHTWKLPSQIQEQLERLHERIAADPEASERMPDFLGTLQELLEGLEEEPVSVTLNAGTPDEVAITIGPYDVQRTLTGMLADRSSLEYVPGEVLRWASGDWTWVAETAHSIRVDGLPVPILALMMDCSSGASPKRKRRLNRERRDPANLLADAIDGYYREVCIACGDPDLGNAFRGPLECDTSVLFVSGVLDARTPPENVDEIRAGFPNSVHVVVDNVGHAPRELMLPEFRELIAAFLRGEEVTDQELALPPLRFRFDDGR